MGRENHAQALASADHWVAAHALRESEKRPVYHFAPPYGWMNDPNGLIQVNGRYHLFYQHHPYGTQWAHMHWGHAISEDLMRWTDCPEALAPAEPYDFDLRGGCYSGSAVPFGEGMALLYTGCVHRGETEVQTQNLAYSLDGVHFTKAEQNPVLAGPPVGASEHFRDPKAWRQGDWWYMVVCNSVDGHGCVRLYRSADLLRWEHRGVLLTAAYGEGWMWECPDLFELDGHWMLTVSAMGSTAGENLWFVGTCDLEAGRFTVKRKGTLDAGRDFYAAQTFLDERGRRMMIAWADSRSLQPGIAADAFTASAGYCGHMTLPRRVRISPEGEPRFTPVEETQTLRRESACGALHVQDGQICPLCAPMPASLEAQVNLRFCANGAERVVLTIHHDDRHVTRLEYRRAQGALLLDRTQTDDCNTGIVTVAVGHPVELSFRFFLDRTSLEVFIGQGENVLSANLFAQSAAARLTLAAFGGAGAQASWTVWELRP